MNKLIRLSEPSTSNNEISNILKVFKKKNFVDGYYQNRTETLIKKILKVNHCALTTSCSTALEVAALILNLKKGDEVLLPSFTFSSTANAIILRGAKPIFVDISPQNLNIDIQDLKRKITQKTKAIFLVHYAGFSCDLDEIIKLQKKFKFYIVEDAAHAFLGKYKNKYLGTFGDIGTYSFHQTKNFTGAGQCGAIIINNKRLIKKVDSILDKGTNRREILRKNETLIRKKNKYYSWVSLGSEFRASEISSAFLYAQLLKRKELQLKRKIIWNNYANLFSSLKIKNIRFLFNQSNNKHPYHLFVIIFKYKNDAANFINFLQKNKISATFHYIPLHISKYAKKFINSKNLNITTTIFNKIVRLPLHSNISMKDLNYINNKIKFYFKNKVNN